MSSMGKGSGKSAPPGKGSGKSAPPKAPPPKAKPKAAPSKPVAGVSLGLQAMSGTAEAFQNQPDSLESTGDSCSRPSAVDPKEVPLDELQKLFEKGPPASNGSSKRTSPVKNGVLPEKVVFNLEVVLRGLKLDTAILAEALGNLTPEACPLTADEAERLMSVLPDTDQLHKLIMYKFRCGETANLNMVEQRLLPLAELNRLAPRLRLFKLAKTLDERVKETMHQAATLQGACRAVRESDVFRDVLQIVLVLFNYVNFGTTPSDSGASSRARIVDVQSLMRLRDTKASGKQVPFSKYNMLHFCIDKLIEQRPELCCDDWNRQLRVLADASDINLSNLQTGLAQLKEDQAFISSELCGHRDDYVSCKVREPGAEPAPRSPECQTNAPDTSQGPACFDLDVSDPEDDDQKGVVDPLSAGHNPSTPLQRVVDAVSFVGDMVSGNAVWGQARHSDEICIPLFAEDGVAPPPGLLLRLRPSGRWTRHWCEVRSSVLVLYRIAKLCHGQGPQTWRILGTSYIVLPFADIVHPATKLAEANPYAFELRPSGRSDAEIFRTNSSNEATRWVNFLEQQARQPGVGYLSVYVGGWFPWKRLFCILSTEPIDGVTTNGPCLLGFAKVCHFVEGRQPDHMWPLTNAIVRFLDADGASSEAKMLVAASAPYGLELEDFDSRKRWQFACDSLNIQDGWYQVLANPGVKQERSVSPPQPQTLLQSFCLQEPAPDENELLDLFTNGEQSQVNAEFLEVVQPAGVVKPVLLSFAPNLDESPSTAELLAAAEPAAGTDGCKENAPEASSTSDVNALVDKPANPEEMKRERLDTESSIVSASTFTASTFTSAVAQEPAEPDALAQLKRFDAEMSDAVERWTCALSATEADCRSLLTFFGFEVPSDGTKIAASALQLLEALSCFQGQVSTAWNEIQKHRTDSKQTQPSQRRSLQRNSRIR